MRERIAVTGANGFVGRQVCHDLLAAGKQVTACTRNPEELAAAAGSHPSLRLFKVSSLASTAWEDAFHDASQVIHLAGRAHVMHETASDPLAAFRTVNVEGTRAVASAARDCGVDQFLYVSSIKVNGEITYDRPFTADDPPGYSDAYGQSRWEAEEALKQIARKSPMQWIIVRPPLIYGPGVRGNFLALLRLVMRGLPLPLANIRNSRSMISVYNISSFLLHALDQPAAANQCFLVSDREQVSTPDLVRRLEQFLRQADRIFAFPISILSAAAYILRREDVIRRLCTSLVIDMHKSQRLLNWNPCYSLDAGLERTAQWFLLQQSGAA